MTRVNKDQAQYGADRIQILKDWKQFVAGRACTSVGPT